MKVPGVSRLMTPLFLPVLAVHTAANPGFHLLKKIPLSAAPGGREYFDYLTVDASARRAYLSHGTEVKVVDADTSAVVGVISGLKLS